MSEQAIEVKHVVVHILDKQQNGDASERLSPEEGMVTEASQRLINDICAKYAGRTGKGYGYFEGDADNYPMERMASDYVDGVDGFYPSSCRMMHHLTERSQRENMATGGYVLFANIVIGNNEHLLIAIVSATIGSTVTDDFNIQDSTYLDIAKLRMAGRIDLTAWQGGAERYISFLKGQGNVSNYFKQFLGCNDVLIAKRESEKLRDALTAFAADKELDGAEKDAFLKSAFEHLHALSKAGEPLSLETFVNAVWPQAPEELSGKLAAEELELSDGFVPDGRVIRALVSFKGKSKYWELKFDREGKTEGYIDYDPETNIITLRNVPDEFREMWMNEV
ncbi:nucleoid-associated protein [Yersinia enterocolitica]|uniref:nucleoid-associated protein n=1 Tax=Enterobacterales TaxID=91347 RepID=UPI0007945CEF|nr:nucleoid-associated protein [Enterobacter hormaechei]ELX2304284.1 nucleoid-associated protein [Yersinia enterocolitica]MCQ7061420.1 nucleoid-associated protein [Escherichia coli]SAE43961.1 nucleoid-associated protein NdpA [Enterobacter hormaechei]